MAEKESGNILFKNMNNLLAIIIFFIFALVIFAVLFLLRYQNQDILVGLEKVFLVFEGIIGAVIGYYFGHQPIENVEARAKEEEQKRMEAYAENKTNTEIAVRLAIKKEKELKDKQAVIDILKENLNKYMEGTPEIQNNVKEYLNALEEADII